MEICRSPKAYADLSDLSFSPYSATSLLVMVGSRLIRALQSLIVSVSIPVVWATARSRQSRMSSSAPLFHGLTGMCLVRS